MKNTLKLALVALVAVGAAQSAHAYTQTFQNHTGKSIIVRIQLSGLGEPYYYALIPAGQGRGGAPDNAFRFETAFPGGKATWDQQRKVGFCVAKIEYRVLTAADKKALGTSINGKAISGYPMSHEACVKPYALGLDYQDAELRWVQTKSYQELVEASQKLSSNVATTLKEALDIATEGATAALPVDADGIIDALTTLIAKTPCASRNYHIITKERDAGKPDAIRFLTIQGINQM